MKGLEMPKFDPIIAESIADIGDQLIRLGELLKKDANTINATNLNKAAELVRYSADILDKTSTVMIHTNH
jgi:hypothetical protein